MKLNLTPNHQLRIRQTIFRLALFSFVVVVIWIGFEIYFSYTKRQTSKQALTLSQKVEPISPNLYPELAQSLSQKRSISPTELNDFKPILHQLMLQKQQQQTEQSGSTQPLLTSLTPNPSSPSATPAPTSSPSAQPNPFIQPSP